jgi:hypothetical protein
MTWHAVRGVQRRFSIQAMGVRTAMDVRTTASSLMVEGSNVQVRVLSACRPWTSLFVDRALAPLDRRLRPEVIVRTPMIIERRWAVACLMALMVSGCGAELEDLRTRAAFDLQCPEKKVHLHYIDDRTQGVIACGQQATYVESCENPGKFDEDCTWVLNGSSRRGR